MALAIVLYGFGAIDLLRFALLYLLHALAGLIFVSTSPFFLPKVTSEFSGGNPFTGPAPVATKPVTEKRTSVFLPRKDREQR